MAPAERDRGRHLVRGGLLVAAASVAARGASFVAQLVLGRLLLPEDFGLFAIALTFTTLAAAANSVVRSFLVDAMKRELDLDAVYRLVVWTTVAVTVLFAAATPLLAKPFDEPGLVPILFALNLTMPLQVLPALGMARLTNELRFGELSKLWMVSGVARQAATVAAALAGWGAMSFVVGVVVGSVLEWYSARRATGASPSWLGKIDVRALHLDAHGLRVLPVSILVLALWINGDYASAGLFETAAVVGVYFFAYQLTTALTQPFTLAVSSVLLPRFRHDQDGEREQDAFGFAMLMVPLLSGLPFGLLAVLAAPLTHLVWGGEWNAAIEAIVILGLVTPVKLMLSTSLSVLQARGDWSGYTRLLAASATVAVGSAAVGGLIGGVRGLAGAMAVGTVVMGVYGVARVGRTFGLSIRASIEDPMVCWSIWVLSVGLAALGAPLVHVGLGAAPTRLVIFLLASVPLVYALYGDQVGTVWRLAGGRSRQPVARGAAGVPGRVSDETAELATVAAAARLRLLEEALASRPAMGWSSSGTKAPPPMHRNRPLAAGASARRD